MLEPFSLICVLYLVSPFSLFCLKYAFCFNHKSEAIRKKKCTMRIISKQFNKEMMSYLQFLQQDVFFFPVDYN